MRSSPEEDWTLALTPPPLPWYGLLVNPAWTSYHAGCNTLQRFIDDPASYPDVRSLVMHQMAIQFPAAKGCQFQIHIGADVLFLSPFEKW